MDDLRRIQEDIIGESCYSDSDLTDQMREKIRTQAQRLRNLEQYRVICEQRIQELSPGHVFPVKPEHLGKINDTHAELQQARMKIKRLEAQIHEMGRGLAEEGKENCQEIKIYKEKSELEASLRAEMLVCEEQRAYIEVLKQALEEKNESPVMVKVESRKNLRVEEEIRKEIKEKKEREADKDKEERMNKGKAKDEERWKHLLQVKDEEIQEILNSKRMLEDHLDKAGEALQIAEDEIAKLEEEKSNLLDYVEEHSSKEQEMEKELNDLSSYFQSMKSEYDLLKQESFNTHKKLELELRKTHELSTKNESLTEEIFKLTQGVNNTQDSITSLKQSNNEKDLLIKKLKEEKLSMEILIENLQANSSTLAETLKETQVELEESEKTIKELKKSELARVENSGKMKAEQHSLLIKNENLSEELEDLKRQLENSKSLVLKHEKTIENTSNIVSDLKTNLTKYKSKCESLEDRLRVLDDLEQLNSINEEKLSQLQEELLNTQDEYREIQQRELIQIEALNSLRKHNSELSREIEELYKEHQALSIEYSQKTQDLHETFKNYESTQKLIESQENTRKSLETQIKSEKNLNKQLKDLAQSSKFRSEELENQLLTLQETLEKTQKKLKICEEESSKMRVKCKALDRELEEERIKKVKLNDDLSNLENKLKESEVEFDKVQSEIIECYKVVASFAGKYTIIASDTKYPISQGYKEFLLLWKDKISTNCSILPSWVQNTVDEIESMSKQIYDLQKEVDQSNNNLFKLTTKLEDVNCEDFCNKQEQTRLKNQVESWATKCDSLEKTHQKIVNELKTDLATSQKDLGHLLTEHNALKSQLMRTLNESQEHKKVSDSLKLTIKTSEDRINSLKTEKSQLENLVKQVQRTFGTGEISKIHGEIARIRPELEVLEREKLNIECQLLKYESDPRAKDSLGFRDLNSKLLTCERQISNYKRTLNMLQEDVNKEQIIQSLRLSDRETVKSVYKPENLPKSISLSSSRLVESSKSLRRKSPVV